MCYLSNFLSENSPPPMPTTNQPQAIDLDKHEGDNVQKKKKQKVREAYTNDDSNVGNSSKQKSCRPKYWV